MRSLLLLTHSLSSYSNLQLSFLCHGLPDQLIKTDAGDTYLVAMFLASSRPLECLPTVLKIDMQQL